MRMKVKEMKEKVMLDSIDLPLLDEQNVFLGTVAMIDLIDGHYDAWKQNKVFVPTFLCIAEQMYAERTGLCG